MNIPVISLSSLPTRVNLAYYLLLYYFLHVISPIIGFSLSIYLNAVRLLVMWFWFPFVGFWIRNHLVSCIFNKIFVTFSHWYRQFDLIFFNNQDSLQQGKSNQRVNSPKNFYSQDKMKKKNSVQIHTNNLLSK